MTGHSALSVTTTAKTTIDHHTSGNP